MNIQIPRYEPYPERVVQQNNNDGCLTSCLKDLCSLVAKVCQVILAVFSYIFSCRCCDDDQPEEVLRHRIHLAPRVPNLHHFELPIQELPPQPVVQRFVEPNLNMPAQANPVALPERDRLVKEYYESMLDDDGLKALLAASGDAYEIGVIEDALRQRKAEGYEKPAEPVRAPRLPLFDPLARMANPAPGIWRLGEQGLQATAVNLAPTPIAWAIPLRPVTLPVAEDRVAEPCPVAPLRMVGEVGDGTPLPALIQFIKDEIVNNGNWQFDLSTWSEINVPVTHRNEEALKKIRKNCDLLTQEHWIQILHSITPVNRPTPVILLSRDGFNSLELSEKDIKERFQLDREVVLKQRLAVLAKVWVDAKTPLYMGRNRDQRHPFQEMYQDIGSNLDQQVEQTLVAFQETSRFLPLIKAFAAQKKEILIQHPGLEERTLSVNYLLDSVLSISTKLTGLIIHNQKGPSQFKKSGGNSYQNVLIKELNSDKIASGADTLWNAYLKAKANQDLKNFASNHSFNGYCFDARISSLNSYIKKFANNPDFILNPEKLNGDFEIRVGEYYEVFLHEQMAIYCERQEPKLGYEAFKHKIEGERASSEAKQDPVNIDFFKNYATQDRFKAWAIQVGRDNRTAWGLPMFPSITDGNLWEKTLYVLANDIMLDFEP